MASRFEQLLTAFAANLNDSSVRLLSGRVELQSNTSIPRITHIGLGSTVTDPDLVGGGLINLEGTIRDRIVRVRQFQIAMYVHGQTIEQAEQLLHNAIAAWELTCSGSLSFSDETWLDQQEGADDRDRHGHQILLTVTVNIPVYAAPKPLTFVRSIAQDDLATTGNLYGDGSSYGNGRYHTGDIVSVSQSF